MSSILAHDGIKAWGLRYEEIAIGKLPWHALWDQNFLLSTSAILSRRDRQNTQETKRTMRKGEELRPVPFHADHPLLV
jgi:hypothetical protein